MILALFAAISLAANNKIIWAMDSSSSDSDDDSFSSPSLDKDDKKDSKNNSAEIAQFVRDLKSSSSHDFNAIREFVKDLRSSRDFGPLSTQLLAFAETAEDDVKPSSSSTASTPSVPLRTMGRRATRCPRPLGDYRPTRQSNVVPASPNNNSCVSTLTSSPTASCSSSTTLPASSIASVSNSPSSSSSSSTSTKQQTRKRSNSFTEFAQPTIPEIDQIPEEKTSVDGQTKALLDSKNTDTHSKTTVKTEEEPAQGHVQGNKHKKKIRRSNSLPKIELEKWVFNNLNFTICAPKGELVRIYTIILRLYQDAKIKGTENNEEKTTKERLLRKLLRLHTWVNFGFRFAHIGSKFYTEMPEDLQELCGQNHLCDEKNRLTDLARYMILSVLDKGTFTNLEMLMGKKIIQTSQKRNEDLMKEMAEGEFTVYQWKFQTPIDGTVSGYLRVSSRTIKRTYGKMLKLNNEQRFCLSQIIEFNTTPTTDKYIEIRNFLIKKHLINADGTIPLLVKYLHYIGRTTEKKHGVSAYGYISEDELLKSCIIKVD